MNEAVENNTIVKTGAPKKPFQGKNIGIYARKNARGGIHIYIRTNIGKEYCTVVEGSTADEKKIAFHVSQQQKQYDNQTIFYCTAATSRTFVQPQKTYVISPKYPGIVVHSIFHEKKPTIMSAANFCAGCSE